MNNWSFLRSPLTHCKRPVKKFSAPEIHTLRLKPRVLRRLCLPLRIQQKPTLGLVSSLVSSWKNDAASLAIERTSKSLVRFCVCCGACQGHRASSEDLLKNSRSPLCSSKDDYPFAMQIPERPSPLKSAEKSRLRCSTQEGFSRAKWAAWGMGRLYHKDMLTNETVCVVLSSPPDKQVGGRQG